MHDLQAKIESIEQIDYHIVRPLIEYFQKRPAELGGVVVVPDHYSNCQIALNGAKRLQAHSAEPTPFALWNGRDVDRVRRYSEDAAIEGRFGKQTLTHLDLLDLIGLRR